MIINRFMPACKSDGTLCIRDLAKRQYLEILPKYQNLECQNIIIREFMIEGKLPTSESLVWYDDSNAWPIMEVPVKA